MSVGRFAGNAFEGLQLPTVTDFMNPKEDYGKTATRGMAERAATDATSMTEIAKIHGAGIGKEAAIESAKHLGEARRYAGQQAGNAAIFGGIASGVGSLASGYIGGLKNRPAMRTSIPGVNDNPLSTQSPIVDSTIGIPTILPSGGMSA